MYNNDSDSLNTGAPDIRITGNQRMASAPDPMAEMNDFSMKVFGKPLHQLTPPQLDELYELINEQSKAPQQNSGIMASAPKGTYTQNRKNQMMMAGGGVANLKNIKGQDHMLAYITPDEANSLQAMGGQKTMTPEGIPAYPPPGERGGPGSGAEGRAPGGGGGGGEGGGGGAAAQAALSRASAAAARSAAAEAAAAMEDAYNAQAVVDAAVAQAASQVGPPGGGDQQMTYTAPDDIDIDSLYSAEDAYFTPTDTKSPLDKAIDFYKQLPTPLNLLTNLTNKPVNQYKGIEGEDALGGGDFQYTDVRDFSQGEFGTDYESLDQEGQAEVDKAFSDSGGLSDSARDIGLPSSQVEALYDTPTAPTTIEDTPPLIDDLVTTAELTPAEATSDFQASVADQIAKNEAAKAEMPFKDYYVGGDPTAEQTAFMRAAGASPRTLGLEQFAARGGRMGYDQGGIAGLRQPYFLGKAVKKITGAAKKVLKSPIGKAAMLYGGYKYGLPFLKQKFPGTSQFLRDSLFGKALSEKSGSLAGGVAREGGLFNFLKNNKLLAAGALATLSPFLAGKEEDEEDQLTAMYRGKDIFAPYGGIDQLRADAIAGKLKRSQFPFQRTYSAQGGRIGLAEGLNPRIAALRAMYNNDDEEDNKKVKAQEGGLMNLGGMEKDYRQEGGFVPIGKKEKADDVPARLSVNEFVFTADAVRAAGGGDIDKGASIMERLMENLEAGGKVSEESQGLEGARGMFANAQQLEKRII